jgi:hypothetical protein
VFAKGHHADMGSCSPHMPSCDSIVRHPTRLLSDMVVETPQAQAASGVKATYACQVCHRAYERLDHLNRHLDSRKYVPKDWITSQANGM